jgi:CRP-like cAMP-binding protein
MAEPIIFARVPLFRGVDGDVLDALREAATPLRLRKGEFLFRRGEPCQGFYVVVEGLVKLALPSAPGSERTVERAIEVFGPGATFGEDVLFLNTPQVADCQAQARTTVLHVSKFALWGAVERDPLLSARLLRNLSGRLHTLMRDIEAVSLQNALQRVASFLQEQAQASRRTWLACTQRVIASKLGITPETFSRVMSRFSAEKLVKLERGKIFLLDTEGLARQAAA